MKRKFLAWLMSLVLIIGIMPMTALAADIVDSGKCGDNLTWTLDAEGVLTISGEGEMENYDGYGAPWSNYQSNIKTIVIDEDVTSIGDYAFPLSNVANVTLPDSLTKIGNRAFFWCSNLRSIEIPAAVTYIGEEVFIFCTNMIKILVDEDNQHYSSDETGVLFDKNKSILIQAPPRGIQGKYIVPDDVEYIGYYAFCYCENMTEIDLPDSLVGIEEGAFSACGGLTSAEIPNGTTHIGEYAFHYCDDMKKVNIPESVISIGSQAFYSCYSLNQIIVDTNNQNYSSNEDGTLLNKERTELIKVPGGIVGDYVIPKGVSYIGQYAFERCSWLHSVTVPESVTYFSDYAFSNCYELTKVIVTEENEYFSNDENGILYNAEKSEIIYIPGGMNRSYTVPSSVTTIGDWALTDINYLPEMVFVGDAPEYSGQSWMDTTIYYPANNTTWTEEVMESFGDDITWIPYTPHLQGDVDGNGELSNTDLVMVARYIVELYDEDTVADIEAYGDINGDGDVTNTDLITMARIIVGLV